VSVADPFKYRGPDKRAAFPFCRETADGEYFAGQHNFVAAPSDSYDYVTLTASGGDEGLAEAMRLWWNLESVSLTPTGYMERIANYPAGGSREFSGVYGTTPDPANYSYRVRGSVTAGTDQYGTGPTVVQPKERVCTAFNSDTFKPLVVNVAQQFPEFYPASSESGYFIFQIAYVDSQWRLYYKFSFFIYDDRHVVSADIGNPAYAHRSYPDTETGTFDIFGYTLDWEARIKADTYSDFGLSATSSFFTY
jgi:hypothetical protein